MNDSQRTTTNQSSKLSDTTVPRAVVHKQILNAAESRPNASLTTIANDVSGATIELVRNVLDEYGDPAAEDDTEPTSDPAGNTDIAEETNEDGDTPFPTDSSDESVVDAATPALKPESGSGSSGSLFDVDVLHEAKLMSKFESRSVDTETEGKGEESSVDGSISDNDREDTTEIEVPDPETLTEIQLRTLRAIQAHPDETQAELATRFDITSASVSQRVNAIDGFDWSHRQRFADAMFDSSATEPTDDQTATSSTSASMNDTSMDEIQHPPDSDNDVTNNESKTEQSLKADGSNDPLNEGQPHMYEHVSDQLSALTEQVDHLEQQLADPSQSTTASASFAPELAHKVAHACLRSDSISEDEELQILRELMGTDSDCSSTR